MRLRQRLVGALAALGLLAVLVGTPVLLLALGANPFPASVPSLDEARAALLSPDDGTLVLGVLKLVAWIAWIALAVIIVVEIAAQIRGMRAPTLPGLSFPQSAVRPLVSTALALFILAPATAPTSMATDAPAAAPASASVQQLSPQAVSEVTATEALTSETEQQAAPTQAYTVQTGDSLWSIAEQHLGEGKEYPRIAELNEDVLSGGGDWLFPGMELRLPADATTTESVAPAQSVVVEEGDTLSGLADQHLGDMDRWEELFEASENLEQPDGQRLSDPNVLQPGWVIALPTAAPSSATPQTPENPENVVDQVAQSDATQAAEETTAAAGTLAGAVPIAGNAAALGLSPTAQQAGALVQAEPADLEAGAQADVSEQDQSGWVVAGLTGAGIVLGAGAFLALAARRRGQFRHRNPGRAIATPDPVLDPVVKTLETVGNSAVASVQGLDDTLRRLGATYRDAQELLPVLAAVELAKSGLTLHLSEPSELLGESWVCTDDHLHWRLPAGTSLEEVGPLEEDLPAPFPLLVSIGADDDGTVWLLNFEDLEVNIVGDADYAQDFARYIAAEIAVNPWSAGVQLDLVGLAEEVVPMNPARLRVGDVDSLGDAVAGVVGVIDRLGAGGDTVTARTTHQGDDTWPARMVLMDGNQAANIEAKQLTGLLAEHAGRTSASVVIQGEGSSSHAVVLEATAEGRIVMPASGLDLVIVGLTEDEAKGCATLLAQGDDMEDVPMPLPQAGADDEGWRAWADAAGALRPEHTVPRGEDHPEEETASLLDADDQAYVSTAATTAQDLGSLAPQVPVSVRESVDEADPRLEADLSAWWDEDTNLPRLQMLGPVHAQTRGTPRADRKPYLTEMVAYLVLRPQGATSEETAEAFSITPAKCRDYVAKCRSWLGTNPRTGEPHLPHAQKAPAAKLRGGSVYQTLDVLNDVDLFRRLRVRGEARGGTQGIEDLKVALSLVQGRPFSQLRPGGWSWLFEGDRVDQHMICAIVDVAHLISTHGLESGDLKSARWAAETATLAAPHEEIPTLDLAAIAVAEGRKAQAARKLNDAVCNRVDDDDSVPDALPIRTQRILDDHDWLDQREVS